MVEEPKKKQLKTVPVKGNTAQLGAVVAAAADAQSLAMIENGPINFTQNAETSQRLKSMVWQFVDTSWPYTAREACDMICLALSRIVNNGGGVEQWKDIADYAQLAMDNAEADAKATAFQAIAEIAQEIKILMHRARGGAEIAPLEAEALDIVAHYFARIISGGVNDKANWQYIVSAAQAVVYDAGNARGASDVGKSAAGKA